MNSSEKVANTTSGKSPLLWFLLGVAGVFLTSLLISMLVQFPLVETFLTLAILTLVGVLLIGFARRYFIIIVPEHQRVVIYRGGRVVREAGPGLVTLFPPFENYRRIDVERVSREGGKKVCTARDGIRLEIEYAVFWQVDKDRVVKSLTRTENPGAAVKTLVEGEIAVAISRRESPGVREALSQIGEEVEQRLRNHLAEIGLKVVATQIMNATAVDSEVQEAINRRVAALMDAEALKRRQDMAKDFAKKDVDKALQVLYLDVLEALGNKEATVFLPLELAYLRQLLSGSEAAGTKPGEPELGPPQSPETEE